MCAYLRRVDEVVCGSGRGDKVEDEEAPQEEDDDDQAKVEDEEASATVEWESEGEHEEDEDVNALARFMTTANAELYVLSKGVLRYLKGVKSRKIVWCASRVKFPFVPC